MDLRISDLIAMQTELQALHPEWGGIYPERTKDQLLWGVAEMGEVIDIFKKRGADGIMNDPETRQHFIEEMADVIMYLTDILLCCNISAEEYSQVHAQKHARNTKRDYVEERKHMFEKKD